MFRKFIISCLAVAPTCACNVDPSLLFEKIELSSKIIAQDEENIITILTQTGTTVYDNLYF